MAGSKGNISGAEASSPLSAPVPRESIKGDSDRVALDLYQLWEKYGRYIFKDIKNYNKWLLTQNVSIQHNRPYDYAQKAGNVEVVEMLLGRLAYGIVA